PFAFLATYTSRLSIHGKAQHQPLGQALREYAGVANKDRLLSLLLPVQRAAERCAWLKQMVDAGEIFHPLRWSPQEALRFLSDIPQLEQAGVVVRMPAAWRAGRPCGPYRCRVGWRRRRTVACRSAERTALARGARPGQSRTRAPGHPAPVSGGRCALAAPPLAAWPRGLPRR